MEAYETADGETEGDSKVKEMEKGILRVHYLHLISYQDLSQHYSSSYHKQ